RRRAGSQVESARDRRHRREAPSELAAEQTRHEAAVRESRGVDAAPVDAAIGFETVEQSPDEVSVGRLVWAPIPAAPTSAEQLVAFVALGVRDDGLLAARERGEVGSRTQVVGAALEAVEGDDQRQRTIGGRSGRVEQDRASRDLLPFADGWREVAGATALARLGSRAVRSSGENAGEQEKWAHDATTITMLAPGFHAPSGARPPAAIGLSG